MEAYETLIKAIEALKNQGYTTDFNIKENLLIVLMARINCCIMILLLINPFVLMSMKTRQTKWHFMPLPH